MMSLVIVVGTYLVESYDQMNLFNLVFIKYYSVKLISKYS